MLKFKYKIYLKKIAPCFSRCVNEIWITTLDAKWK